MEAIIKRTKKTENRSGIPKFGREDYWIDEKSKKMFVVIKGEKKIDYILKVNKPIYKDGEYKYPIKGLVKVVSSGDNFIRPIEVSPPQKFIYLTSKLDFLLGQFRLERIF